MRSTYTLLAAGGFALLLLGGCGGGGDDNPGPNLVTYSLDASAAGVLETINNIQNVTVVSNDPNDLRAEYRAGFVQGKLQGHTILSARDNTWDNNYLTDPGHMFPAQPVPSSDELKKATGLLDANYNSFINYLRASTTAPLTAHRLKRLLFRMLGIYHGVTRAEPQVLDFSGTWLPDRNYLTIAERTLGYETPTLSFLDLYWINANNDLSYVIPYTFPPGDSLGGPVDVGERPDKCSAFVKRTPDDIFLTHNSWMGFLSQSMVQTLSINGTRLTVNTSTPGQIGSGTDFGYNDKGIVFNETTHRWKTTKPKVEGVWIFWRAAAAEQFAASISEFFDLISIDNTGTYLNGYMLIDAKTRETGLVEMSYRCFVYYRSSGGDYTVTTKSTDGSPCDAGYDKAMVTRDYLMGINYPASTQVVSDLGSLDNRPARRVQFGQQLPSVASIEQAKAVITYTDPVNPLSIFGRWDLGYGETDYPKQIPDGSVDAKATNLAMVKSFMGLSGVLDTQSPATGFWMLYGTPKVNGEPFIWSRSSWSWAKRRDVPDRVDGAYTLMNLYLR